MKARLSVAVAILLASFSIATIARVDEKLSAFKRLQQKVKENIVVNGKPLAEKKDTLGRYAPTPQGRGEVNGARAALWVSPAYTPPVLDGAALVRTGAAGIDGFGNPVGGLDTCDLLLVFSAKSRVQLSENTLNDCALDEYRLAVKQGVAVEEINLGHPEGVARAMAMYRPFIAERLAHFAKFDRFYFRPINQTPFKHYSQQLGGLEMQLQMRTWGLDENSNGDGFSGPGWTQTPYDKIYQKRKRVFREDAAVYEILIKMGPEDGAYYEKASAIGVDNRLYAKCNGK